MLEIQFGSFPVIHTGRLVLRQILNDDAPALFGLRSDENVMQYIDRPRPKSMDDILELIQKFDINFKANEGVAWAITLKDKPGMIGFIGCWRMDKENHRCEIGYMLEPAYHRKGLMQEALSACLDYGFSTIKLHSIEACVNPGNVASIALLEHNGFVREAYFKENYYFNGTFKDTAIYSLITPL